MNINVVEEGSNGRHLKNLMSKSKPSCLGVGGVERRPKGG
jgi:hypothetical protein